MPPIVQKFWRPQLVGCLKSDNLSNKNPYNNNFPRTRHYIVGTRKKQNYKAKTTS